MVRAPVLVILDTSPNARYTIRLGIDDIIRTISTYFGVVSETPNAKCTRNNSEMRL
jgi:hypothetical protein